MFQIKVNKHLLPMKISYFFFSACIGPIIGFLPTIAKQLGYSVSTYGLTMTFMSLVSTILSPAVGIVVDRFHVRKKLFMTSLLGIGIMTFFFLFVPKVPLSTTVELKCDKETLKTVFEIYAENDLHLITDNKTVLSNRNELTTCKLNCQDVKYYEQELKESMNNDQSYICDDWLTINSTNNLNEYNEFDVTLILNNTQMNTNLFAYRVLSIQTNDSQIPTEFCQCRLKAFCHITNCSNDAVMDLATEKSFKGNVLTLYQFWIFFIVVVLMWAFIITVNLLQNPICLDILENKNEDFGKQKLWTSVGWGFFSIFIGWLVDICSVNKKEKDYSPVFYSCIILSVFNLIVSNKIKIRESNKSEDQWKSVFRVFTKYHVITFFIWTTLNTLFHTIITHFLFWYMEDLVSENNDPKQKLWLKTLQGLAQGVQCFGGEIPFYFCSGWIIKKLGHRNCMALVLGSMALRMYLYTVIWNPVWIILIELLNGVSFALGYSVTMSYAKIISPPDTINTIIGCIGFVNCLGESIGSFLGGYIFEIFGGVWLFRFFATNSALTCCLYIIINYFWLSKDFESSKNEAVSTKPDVKSTYKSNNE